MNQNYQQHKSNHLFLRNNEPINYAIFIVLLHPKQGNLLFNTEALRH